MYAEIAFWIEVYQNDPIQCNSKVDKLTAEACDAMILGSLIKGCTKFGLWPAPQPPHAKSSISSLLQGWEQIPIRSLCNYEEERNDETTLGDGHSLGAWIRLQLDDIHQWGDVGWDIEDFERHQTV